MSSANLTPIWKPLPAKLRAYEAVYWLNRSFQATLLSLERLEHLGIFRLEYLNEYKVRIEHTRAQECHLFPHRPSSFRMSSTS
jgi:hypothetical protein